MSKEQHKRKRAREMLTKAGYKSGGHLAHPDEPQDKALIKREVKASALRHKLKDGGMAMGGAPKHRSDRKGRGKAHTTVNVVVAGQHPKPQPVPVPVPVGGPGPQGAAPPGAGPGGPGGPMPPPGAGAPPPGFKRGGRTPKEDSQRDEKGGMPAGHFKKGGKTKGYPIKDGAGGGEGRLQKAKAYGA